MLAHLRLGIAIAIVAALGGAVGLSLAIATGPGDVPTAPKLPYDNPGPPAPTAPSFSPDNPPPGVPKAGYKEGLANLHYDASYLAFLLARTAGDESVCETGCGIAAEPGNLGLWFDGACQHIEDSTAFTATLAAAGQMTKAAETLIETAGRTCDELADLESTAGLPNPQSQEWSEFANSRRQPLAEAITAVDPEVLQR
jgi:hypothetical protein